MLRKLRTKHETIVRSLSCVFPSVVPTRYSRLGLLLKRNGVKSELKRIRSKSIKQKLGLGR